MDPVIAQINGPAHDLNNDTLPSKFGLLLRGKSFELQKTELLSLPENILICLSNSFLSEETPVVNDTGLEFAKLDFSPELLDYLLSTFRALESDMVPKEMSLREFPDIKHLNANSPSTTENMVQTDIDEVVAPNIDENTSTTDSIDSAGLHVETDSLNDAKGTFELLPNVIPSMLAQRPAVIVLREDIEYYCMPADPKVTENPSAMAKVKYTCGEQLLKSWEIFSGLRGKDKLDSPEFQVVQMLCLAGMSSDATWPFRQREPNKTIIQSLCLSKLELPKEENSEAVRAVQKLLLFWKRPARKCWWNKYVMQVDGTIVTVHSRRVWTLELSILGVVE